jgi:hypothetical protein
MEFVWVIEPESGEAINRPIRTIRQKGSLRYFSKDTTPDNGPFKSYVALKKPDGTLQPVSPETAMK